MSKLSDAINHLADLYEYGHLDASTDPAGFLDRVTTEIEALRKVSAAAGVVEYDWRDGLTPTHLAFERLGEALAEVGHLDNLRRQQDAIRNREGC